MADHEADREPLEVLASEFIEAQRRGGAPSVEEYAATHPELAEEIRELFPTIAIAEALKVRRERTSSGRASLGPVKIEQLGDFRILREVGRGGMGIVYEAEQKTLGRRVAIKVLPPLSLLDAKHLRLFKREARLAARLHHTNIVPVFGVGEQDGFHYFVMQLIDGPGLHTIVDRLARKSLREADVEDDLAKLIEGLGTGSAYYRAVARIGRDIASALDYAHRQDTLHRDIKPANILLDRQGKAWITDFGLAKVMETDRHSLSGEIAGTLRYVAPEQFDGILDSRSDIYALGVTLFELLALRPAYTETNRTQLVRHIIAGETLTLSRWAPGIPRDLETIILKAAAHDPDKRFPDAGALAEDLGRFLDGQPVRARRIGTLERIWRWCRRNPMTAGSTATAILLLLLTTITVALAYLQTREAYESTNQALTREGEQRLLAEANAELATKALDRVFERFCPRQAVPVMGIGEEEDNAARPVTRPLILSDETATLLEGMLPFYKQLARQTGDEAHFKLKVADASRRIGAICQQLGKYNRAAAAYHQAIKAYGQCRPEEGDHGALQLVKARIHNDLGRLYRLMQKEGESQRSHSQAVTILHEIPPGPLAPQVDYELARTYCQIGARERPLPGAGQPRNRGGRREFPTPKNRNSRVGGIPPHRALQRAVALLDPLVKKYPPEPEYRYWLALCHHHLARSLIRNAPERAARTLDRATDLLDGLVRDFPDIPDYKYSLCESLVAFDAKRSLPPGYTPDRVERRLGRALSIITDLVDQHPNIPLYSVSQAYIHHEIASLLEYKNRPKEVLSHLRKATTCQQSLVKRWPQEYAYQVWLARYQIPLANTLVRQSMIDEGCTAAEMAVGNLNHLLVEHPDLHSLHGLLEKAYRALATALRKSGQKERADRMTGQADMHRWFTRPGGGKPPRRR